jgi:ATP-dependent RNA helicase RhlE
MSSFHDLNLSQPLLQAIDDLGFDVPTPIQEQALPVILSGKNTVGIAQTGTGKTMAYMLPLLRDLKFTKINNPRIVILVPTRELVLQVVEQITSYAKYLSVRILGVYGGTNIKSQMNGVAEGCDILVGTPGRLYDLALSNALSLKDAKKLVIDEVDVMLDLGFRFQLTNIFDLLPERRQNIMFSATMTKEIATLIEEFFIAPVTISIAVSGTRLENIDQTSYPAPNFYTKVNLLAFLLRDRAIFNKVLVFVASKKDADRVFATLEEDYGSEMGIIHSNKSQNYRIRSVKQFSEGTNRILIATDVMARGLDIDNISHVINFDTPDFPENYMHRIGRTGRAEKEGKSILFYTAEEEEAKIAIEILMSHEIPVQDFPAEVEVSTEQTPEERKRNTRGKNLNRNAGKDLSGPSFHEKKAKNKKVNLGGSWKRKVKKYKKPKTKGDKHKNRRK